MKIFIGIVIAAVSAVVITGFILSGTPTNERLRRFDGQRVSDLQQIANTVDVYWNNTHALPESLDVMENNRNYYLPILTDPTTNERYVYRVMATTTYELCATFETDATTEDAKARRPEYEAPGGFWKHPAGPKCFSLEVQKWPKP